ncbi:G2/M phase-specific E3 ubiquitin-protein ligase-like [Drosophila serrata]|uniref:G2/M phase-specific E3 ubiquitin-protein ligase-like n=1 Tax=Drosophila serrata TaxID=7274 RepID=UPI000A1D20FF|nr:G2/M phase-specific E3 ubiquitin-protein ligase-like [Drosophila serrata]
MKLPCVLCGCHKDNELIFGEFVMHDKNSLHRNCLVLCLGKFVQNKTDDIRLWNFLKDDISEVKEVFSLTKCSYCPRLGANLSCCHEGCHRSFHTKCGVDNMAVLQYGGKFDTFCAEHVPEHRSRPEPDANCILCLGSVVANGQDFTPALAFQAPCCHNGWFHRECVQDLSNASTISFKCPLCRNENEFGEVAMYGVAIPKWRYGLPKPPTSIPVAPGRAHTGLFRIREVRVLIARLHHS